MSKRHFRTTASAATAGWLATTSSAPALAASASQTQPTPLTLTGALAKSNRGPFDPALHQMMDRHGVTFTKAFLLDAPGLQRLPAQTGPRTHFGLRAVDGYNITLSLSEVRGG